MALPLSNRMIEGKHVRRGEVAHLITLEALFDMYLEAFYQYNNDDTHASIKQVADVLNKACEGGEKKMIESANSRMIDTTKSSDVLEKMSTFDKANEKKRLFKVMLHYMRMVMEMLTFIKSVRTGDWELHLRALDKVTKYFFTHDQINYARMMPAILYAIIEDIIFENPFLTNSSIVVIQAGKRSWKYGRRTCKEKRPPSLPFRNCFST